MGFLGSSCRRSFGALALCLALFAGLLNPAQVAIAQHSSMSEAIEDRLERGEVVIEQQDSGRVKFVVGRILINEPPERVWPIMVNPFEFQGKISPRMKKVEVLLDKVDRSVLKVTLDVCFLIPQITYLVESDYEPNQRIDFRRVGGCIKDFKGFWQMIPAAGGAKTELLYSMYIDPGFPVPQWIIREGIRGELPRTLTALRNRVNAVYTANQSLAPRSILAVHLVAHTGMAGPTAAGTVPPGPHP